VTPSLQPFYWNAFSFFMKMRLESNDSVRYKRTMQNLTNSCYHAEIFHATYSSVKFGFCDKFVSMLQVMQNVYEYNTFRRMLWKVNFLKIAWGSWIFFNWTKLVRLQHGSQPILPHWPSFQKIFYGPFFYADISWTTGQ